MRVRINLFIICLLLAVGHIHAQSIWDGAHLQKVKQSLHQPYFATTYQELVTEAEKLLDVQPLSAVMKEKTPGSGDKHDYMSQARYYWPDPSKPDGLPYISRDGESNPELNKLDRNRLGATAQRVTTLALAWYFSNDEKYAQKATELIRVWFFNKDTHMNPNLEYAQMIPGHHNNKGRCYGVIDTYSFVEMLDAVQLLEKSKAFTPKDSKQLKAWFGKLLTWILNSPQGQEEANQANNHSTAHDAQVIAFALYAGNVKVAQEVINAIPQRRIFTQIEPDGRQPHELRRTLAFGYSQFNLSHFIDIFLMAQKIGISIDNATSTDGRNFYKAMDFLAPYVGKDVKDWPYQQISEWDYKQQEFCKDLYRVFLLNPERTDYLKLYRAHRTIDWKDRFNLLWVKPDDVDNAYAFACGQLQFAMKCANKARALSTCISIPPLVHTAPSTVWASPAKGPWRACIYCHRDGPAATAVTHRTVQTSATAAPRRSAEPPRFAVKAFSLTAFFRFSSNTRSATGRSSAMRSSVIIPLLQHGPQPPLGPGQPCGHGARRNPKGVCNLLQGKLLIVAQQHDLPVLPGQGEHGPQGGIVPRRVLRRRLGQGGQLHPAGVPRGAEQIPAHVEGNRCNPGALCRLPPEGAVPPPRPEQGLLGRVLRQGGVPQMEGAQPQKPRAVLLHQPLQIGGAARLMCHLAPLLCSILSHWTHWRGIFMQKGRISLKEIRPWVIVPGRCVPFIPGGRSPPEG